jgi:two-component system, OmpR family, alkaline phosphatase synthesis response regulator PhoP
MMADAMTKTKKILIVDDEEDIVISVKMILKKEGYDVTTAPDGKTALSILKKGSFDLVLLDIFMPELSGRQVAEKIRADPKLKGQKIAFMTVLKPSGAGLATIQKLKPVDYFKKPIDLHDFRERIRKILS